MNDKLLQIIKAINDAIKEAGDFGIPSGHLYATLMEFMSLESYQMIIDGLVRNRMITNKGHLLKSVK